MKPKTVSQLPCSSLMEKLICENLNKWLSVLFLMRLTKPWSCSHCIAVLILTVKVRDTGESPWHCAWQTPWHRAFPELWTVTQDDSWQQPQYHVILRYNCLGVKHKMQWSVMSCWLSETVNEHSWMLRDLSNLNILLLELLALSRHHSSFSLRSRSNYGTYFG